MKYSLTKKEAKELIASKLLHYFGVSTEEATDEQFYKAVSLCVKDMMQQGNREFRQKADKSDTKKIYYLSMEFLMGRSLKNNLYNLNLTKVFTDALKDMISNGNQSKVQDNKINDNFYKKESEAYILILKIKLCMYQ